MEKKKSVQATINKNENPRQKNSQPQITLHPYHCQTAPSTSHTPSLTYIHLSLIPWNHFSLRHPLYPLYTTTPWYPTRHCPSVGWSQTPPSVQNCTAMNTLPLQKLIFVCPPSPTLYVRLISPSVVHLSSDEVHITYVQPSTALRLNSSFHVNKKNPLKINWKLCYNSWHVCFIKKNI